MTERLSCTQDGCEFTSEGLCQRGINPVTDCPSVKVAENGGAVDLEQEADSGGSAASGALASSSANSRMTIYSGEALTASEATRFLRDRKSSVVILAGGVDAGKTTLLAELYQLFLKGSVGDVSFAGSHTLMGFERRCFFARLASGAGAPNTERTRYSEEIFLQLLLKCGQNNFTQILISDITGEVFERLRISAEEAKSLSHVCRADHLAILVPCDRLVDLPRRQKARDDAIDVIRRLLEAQLIGPNTRLQVVFSKWDFVTANADSGTHQAFVCACEETMKAGFLAAVKELRFLRLDARSKDPSRLIELLGIWGESHSTSIAYAPLTAFETPRFFSSVSPESVLEGLP